MNTKRAICMWCAVGAAVLAVAVGRAAPPEDLIAKGLKGQLTRQELESDPWKLEPVVAAVLQNNRPETAAARATLAEGLCAAWLDSKEPPASDGRVQRLRLAGLAAGLLPEARKRPFIDAIEKDYLNQKKDLASLTVGGAKTLYLALEQAGQPNRGMEAVCAWMEAGDTWRKPDPPQADPVDMARLDYAFAAYTGTSAKVAQQRAALVEYLWKYLDSDAALARLPANKMLTVVFHVTRLLTAEQKRALGERVAAWLTGRPAALETLTTEEVLFGRSALARLVGETGAAGVTAEWLRLTDRWKVASSDQLTSLIEDALRAKAVSKFGARRAAEVAEGVSKALLQRPPRDLRSLSVLASFMEGAGLNGRGKGSEAYAKALAGAIRAGTRQGDWQLADGVLAWPVRSPETRKIIHDELTDKDGLVRLNAARVLAWSYEWDKLPDWGRLVNEKLAERSVTGDARATWLAAKGYVEAIAPAEIQPGLQIPWLNQAMACATSENVRLTLTEELARAYYAAGRKDVAVSVLGGLKPKFGPEGQARVIELQAQARKDQLAEQKRAAEDQARGKVALKQSRLAYYQRRLGAARRAGDDKAVADLEKAIAQLQSASGK